MLSTPLFHKNQSHRHQPCALFVGIRGIALATSRLPILRHLSASGWRVVAASNPDEYVERLTRAGIEFAPVPFHGGGLAPWRDVLALLQLVRLYRQLNPTFIHHSQVKPVILGCAAARFCPQATVVNLITGLGHAYNTRGFVQRLASTGYRFTLGRAVRTIFQNSDDRQLFLDAGLIQREASELIVSSGVDVERFRPAAVVGGKPFRIVMPTRLLWEKGVGEFVEAAKQCRRISPDVRFQLAGEMAPKHPNGVPRSQIDQWVSEDAIEYLGVVRDMVELYQRATIVVLPSYYREGVPRVLLEAAACGVPVITCDTPGCREAVEDQVTGLRIPPRNSQTLAKSIMILLGDAELRGRMARAGRLRVERLFDQRAIVARHLAVYREIGLPIDCRQTSRPTARHAA